MGEDRKFYDDYGFFEIDDDGDLVMTIEGFEAVYRDGFPGAVLHFPHLRAFYNWLGTQIALMEA